MVGKLACQAPCSSKHVVQTKILRLSQTSVVPAQAYMVSRFHALDVSGVGSKVLLGCQRREAHGWVIPRAGACGQVGASGLGPLGRWSRS